MRDLVEHPKTTMAGYLGYIGTALAALGGILTLAGQSGLGALVTMLDSALAQGAASAGNVASADGGR